MPPQFTAAKHVRPNPLAASGSTVPRGQRLVPRTFVRMLMFSSNCWLISLAFGFMDRALAVDFRADCLRDASRDACRINFLALNGGGCRPLIMAAVMSGASHGRRRWPLAHKISRFRLLSALLFPQPNYLS